MSTFLTRVTTVLPLLATPLLFAQTSTLGPADSNGILAVSPGETMARRTVSGSRINVIALLSDPPLAQAVVAARPANAPRKNVPWTAVQQRAYVANLIQKQSALITAAASLGGTVQAQLTKSINGVVFSIDAARVPALAAQFGVAAVKRVEDTEYSATVPDTAAYIGALNLQSRIPGIDGTGIRIAVLDSGIDYTHRNLGGAGTGAAYQAAYGVTTGCAATAANTGNPVFTAKVVGGYDFVGEAWPNSPLAPDPNPIDCEGHGTSVSDIIAGRSLDGTWKGVAPGAQLYAVRVCSAVSTSCSGVAILQGIDFAFDPNGDGDISDAVDVINMSLGASYGMRESPDSFGVQIAAAFGIVPVIAAGNDADAPYIVGSPSSAPEAISVAQTQVSDALTYPLILVPAVTSPSCTGSVCTNTAWQPWSEPAVADITGPLFIPSTNIDGCAAFTPGSLSGYVVLIARGTCNISVKTSNASAAGALGVVLSDNVAGDPPVFAFGAGAPPFRTTISITQQLGNVLRAVTGTAVAGGKTIGLATISRTSQISLAGSMVSSSARGPSIGYTGIKPDIGAPGASIAAVVGTGTGTAAFGGTSGATPVISGAAALMLQANPTHSTADIKARLMNTAVTNVLTNPASLPGVLAPITRIGAGEVRVNRAADTQSAMWDASNPGAVSLSFGYQAIPAVRVFRKRVVVRNYGVTPRTWSVATSFRYANDQASGAVTLSAPGSVTVPANSSSIFTLNMTVDPARLPVWSTTGINSGSQAANGPLLQSVEFDGYVTLTAGAETLSLPWHILPRASHNGTAGPGASFNGTTGSFTIANPAGAVPALFDIFSLTGVSPQLTRADFPLAGDGFQTVDLQAVGVRGVNIGTATGTWGGTTGAQFGVSSYDLRSTANSYPQIVVLIDSNNDGIEDWAVFTSPTTTNTNAVFMQSLGTCSPSPCPSTAFFFTTVDLNSGNMILTIPALPVYQGVQQTLIPANAPFRFTVLGVDGGLTGDVTDVVGPMTYQLNLPKYQPAGFSGTVSVNGSLAVGLTAVTGGSTASPSQTGFLVLYRDGQPQREASTVIVP